MPERKDPVHLLSICEEIYVYLKGAKRTAFDHIDDLPGYEIPGMRTYEVEEFTRAMHALLEAYACMDRLVETLTLRAHHPAHREDKPIIKRSPSLPPNFDDDTGPTGRN